MLPGGLQIVAIVVAYISGQPFPSKSRRSRPRSLIIWVAPRSTSQTVLLMVTRSGIVWRVFGVANVGVLAPSGVIFEAAMTMSLERVGDDPIQTSSANSLL